VSQNWADDGAGDWDGFIVLPLQWATNWDYPGGTIGDKAPDPAGR